MPKPPTRKTRATRSRPALRQALLELLEENSLEQITIREIASTANVGYATFFRHYPDKDALLHDLASDEISRLLTMTLPLFYTAETLSSSEALCTYVWTNRTLWKGLLAGGAVAALKAEYLRQGLEVLEQMEARDAWLPGELALTFTVSSIIEVLGWWLKQDKPMPIKSMAEVLHRLTILPVMEKN